MTKIMKGIEITLLAAGALSGALLRYKITSSINYPLVIEVVEEQSRLDPLLTQIKRMVGGNGLVTIQEVYAL